jgi:lipopolysaccharide/colanic/teichoic acid biosynthesis glycosyltransferase
MKQHRPYGLYEKCVKRPLDLLCSLLALIVLSWLFLILALLVKVKLGSPVIYSTMRVGRRDPKTGEDRQFRLYKFRSMTNERGPDGKLLPDKDRLTRFGRILRATSLDELPELVNILRGDMSLIGPRPLPPLYLPFYTAKERHRHDVRPGLSGLAQVSGRNAIGWTRKFAYDVEYIEKITFAGDLKILWMTVRKVLVREGIGQGEERPTNLHEERAAWIRTEAGAIPPEAAETGATAGVGR